MKNPKTGLHKILDLKICGHLKRFIGHLQRFNPIQGKNTDIFT